MPTESPPATSQETWVDWLPEARQSDLTELLSRDELLQELQERGVDVNARTLASWEGKGVLPRAVRRWRDGGPAALYPEQAIGAVEHLHRLRAEGMPLQTIKPLVRSWFRTRLAIEFADPEAQRAAREKWLPSPEDLEPQVTALAHRHRRVHGGPPITKAEIRFTDATGAEFVAHSFTPPSGEQ